MLRILHLYRPTLPSLRAQAIQVVHSCHALAARGHEVRLLANNAGGTPEEALAGFGLAAVPGLDLALAPSPHPGLAGLWFRAEVLRWLAGPPGVVIVRDEQPHEGWMPLGRHRVVVEAHALESLLKGEASLQEAEARLAGAAEVFVANCEGTLAAWEEAQTLPARRAVLHNATSPDRRREARATKTVIRAAGSAQAYKGHAWFASIASCLPAPLEFRRDLPYPEVPDWLAEAGALLLPLEDNRFGQQMTSPLKLWDYLATAVPIVAPDLPSVRAAAAVVGAQLHLFRAGDAVDLARAAREALEAGPRAPIVRTWDERAAAWEALLA